MQRGGLVGTNLGFIREVRRRKLYIQTIFTARTSFRSRRVEKSTVTAVYKRYHENNNKFNII